MLYDISSIIDDRLQVWPGDEPVRRELRSDMQQGDRSTASIITSTVHLGTHADAPNHILPDGVSIADQPLETYLGPCRVIRVSVPPGTSIKPADLPDEVAERRVLFATGSYPDRTVFNEDFSALSLELADHLAERQVCLVGVDTPSVDVFTTGPLPVHTRCFERGIALLEGLRLADVPAGRYELVALPLKLAGFDASPVRAVLRTLTT